ncbi:MAG: methyltransferase domain-containing protein [Nitrospirae bacterium]|nr:methyltransferase domain-containing protein [Nitrospirota bacterium]
MTNGYVGWKGWQGTDFGRCCTEDALYYEQELQASGMTSVLGLLVGELGYGNGAFAGWVQSAGGQWVGREAISELQHRAVGAGFKVIPSKEAFSHAYGPGTFDLMVAFDVIEHLELDAIRSFLGEANEALRPGGLLLVRLPSGDSPFSLAIYRGDLTHRTLLGSGAIRQLALEAGFEVSQVRSPVLPLWGLGPLRAARRMAVRGLQTVVFSFIRQVLMGHGSAVISPNMMVVLRKEAATL